jgi:polyphosphate glucokinase
MSSKGSSIPANSPLTLTFDIGGSHLKAGVLSTAGQMVKDRVRIVTPHPAEPEKVVEGLMGLAQQLGPFDRVTIGFPGVVRSDTVLTAPNLGNELWHGFKLATVMSGKLGKPVRMLNDASVQGLGVITGHGVECVLTMGTGMGFALFVDGLLAPHLELSQHPFKGGKTYDQYVGARAVENVGPRRFNKRVRKVIEVLETVVMYDVLYIGGGNSRLIEPPLPENVKTVSNKAGITGGVRAWDKRMDHAFDKPLPAFNPGSEQKG